MFTWIANAARSFWSGPSQNVEQVDRSSTPESMREQMTAGLLQYQEADTPDEPSRVYPIYASIVFVPDISQTSRDTWKSDGDHFWPNKSLDNFLVYTFDYDTRFAYDKECDSPLEAILSYDAIRMIALRLLSDLQKVKNQFEGVFSPILIAHGYGGLICEQAYLFSRQVFRWDGLIEFDGLVLFGTPHFLAGLAQWALISVKKLGRPCKDSPALEDWSRQTLDENLKSIADMQKEFRDFDSGLRMACYFSLLPVPESKLKISAQWAILPGVKATALNTHHFEMTKVSHTRSQEADDLLELLKGKLPCRISQEELKRRWVKSSQTYHKAELDPSHLSIMRPIVKRDNMFSPNLNQSHERDEVPEEHTSRRRSDNPLGSSPGWALPDRESGVHHMIQRRCNNIIEEIGDDSMTNDTRWLKRVLRSAAAAPAILDQAVREPTGLAALRALFVLRGENITITANHLLSTASNTDALELILLLRGDQVFTTRIFETLAAAHGQDGVALIRMLLNRYGERNRLTDMKDILKAACANEENGAAVTEILLKWFSDQDRTPSAMGEIFKAAAVNRENGDAVMKTIIIRYGNTDIDKLDEIVLVAAANPGSGGAIVQSLLDTFGTRIELTERLAKAAAENVSPSMRVEVSTILLHAAMTRDKGDTVFARLLFEPRGSHVGQPYATLSWQMLSSAATRNDKEICKVILESGQIDEDLKGFDGGTWTPLFYAIFVGDEDVIKALVDYGHVNIDNVDIKRNNQPALAQAAARGLTEAVKSLLTIEGIQVDARDGLDLNRTPLMHAVREGHLEIVRALLGKGADVNAEDDEMETPLSQAKKTLSHSSSRDDRIVIMELLYEAERKG